MKIYEKDGYTFVEMPTYVSANNLDETVNHFIEADGKEGVEYILDMSHVTHLYSSGITLIIRIHKQIADTKGKLYILYANDEIRNGIKGANLDQVIPVFESDIDFELAKASGDI